MTGAHSLTFAGFWRVIRAMDNTPIEGSYRIVGEAEPYRFKRWERALRWCVAKPWFIPAVLSGLTALRMAGTHFVQR